MPKFKKETSDVLDVAARKSLDPYDRRVALDIAYLVSKNKLPSSLINSIVKSDAYTMKDILDRISRERPEDIQKWLIANRELIMNPPRET